VQKVFKPAAGCKKYALTGATCFADILFCWCLYPRNETKVIIIARILMNLNFKKNHDV